MMRLVCPNCDAQYEVDDHAIPDAGRDVQCSNCGHAWFQLPPDLAPDDDEESEHEALAAVPDPEPVGIAASPAHPAEEPMVTVAAAAAPAAALPPRRSIDEALLSVLREEAEREVAARKAEAARGVETQPDLGLTGAAPTERPAPPTPGTEPSEAEADRPITQRPGNRRDLLPDIEEINSTLRAGSETRGDEAAVAPVAEAEVARNGFRSGFVAMLVIAAILLALYVMAPRIARHLPGAAPAMQTYVEGVNGLRIRLDSAMQGVAARLRGMTGQGE
ncbi:MAG: zinc-ribbon domain-containing protein [Paracoccaceae bacterium]|nr:MAG: zinc-ribbon domain-containing protein [Paracoccaceae bacterium]